MRCWLLVLLAACGSSGGSSGDDAPGDGGDTGGEFASPPPNAKADYQLGGGYTPLSGVTVVSRDRTDTPAVGLYNICYVNGFQVQPGEEAMWMSQHPDLILKDNGAPVIDQDWNEMLIDVSTPAKRTAVADIVSGWIVGCKQAGFDAIEIDNLDSYSRSHSLLAIDDNVAAMGMFSASAHSLGMAIAQKNSSEIVARKNELGTDFAVAEECNHYDECDAYRDGYGDHLIVIEYERADFTKGCTAYPGLSIVLRDRDLVMPGNGAYVYDGC